MGLSRDGDVVELESRPRFNYGQKVRSRKTVRNDGTFPGKDIGEILIKKGEEGYVVSIGTFLQQFYIYGVDFVARGYRVGMKARELEPVEVATAPDLVPGRTSEASRASVSARDPRLDPIGEEAAPEPAAVAREKA